MKRILFVLAAALLAFAACRKDSEFTETTTIYTPSTQLVRASIGGKVIDEWGGAVADATVRLGNSTTTTDKNGVFMFREKIVAADAAYVKVEHPNYFHGSRTLLVTPGSVNTVRIQLLSNQTTRTVDAAAGGTADYADYSVTLPAGGVMTESGADYNGTVGVAAKWLNPTSENFALQMPGQLVGITSDGQRSGMVSMGMLAVELRDGSGQKLQVKTGHEASIRMKVPAALLASAPATIPLWYFDEEKGLWIEDGQAALNGDFYEGKVKHFTFWNTDYKDPLVKILFKVVDSDGNPLPGALVHTQLASTGQWGFGTTDTSGQICGLVPQNEVLDAKIYANSQGCSSPVLTQQIGPFAADGMYTFTVNLTAVTVYTITGTLTDCNGDPVTNGYVTTDTAGIAWTDAQGNFEIQLVACSPISSVTLKGFDLTALKESQPVVVTLPAGGGTVSAGTIQVCDALSEYFTITVGGNTATFVDGMRALMSQDTASGGGVVDALYLSQNPPTQPGVYFSASIHNATAVGIYPANSMYASGTIVLGTAFSLSCWNGCNVNFDITEHSGVGGYVAGSYSGTIDDQQTGLPVPISGTFRMKLQ